MGVKVLDKLEELAQIARTRPEKLKEEKGKGAKLVGYIGRFVPEELLYASGALPYLMCRGGEPEPPDAVIPYMLRFMSPYDRAQIGYHLLGMDPVMPMLDLVVAQCSDCHESRLADMLEYFKLPTLRLGVPPDWQKSLSREYYQKRLAGLKQKLEALTGNKITDERLKKSTESINKLRDILSKINLLRKRQPPPIGGYDFIRLNHYSFYCHLEELLPRLDELYAELEKGKSSFPPNVPRLLLAGHVVGVGDYVVPKLIEDAGGVVVAEFLDEGMRQPAWKVKTSGDLMANLVDTYYAERTPPSIFQPAWEKRADIIKNIIKDFNIDGVIWYQLSFEEIYDLESSLVAKAMDEIKIPFLKLESSYEYSREAVGPLTTRVESFVESVRQRRS
jgi:benzoyl-CoA reductase/2-hydroxyglutaryl-CoA dehydratase subunit BcrC/BadD/HgdB